MKLYIIPFTLSLTLVLSACEMPQMPTVGQCRNTAVNMFKQAHGSTGKITVKTKHEDDGYEFLISNGKNIEEVDCSFWGQCEFDD